ncbi:MAG: LSU ribosomal protein L34p, partial [uncultured Thermomicrobiales bacterium]
AQANLPTAPDQADSGARLHEADGHQERPRRPRPPPPQGPPRPDRGRREEVHAEPV